MNIVKAALFAGACLATTAEAATLVPGGGWTRFFFDSLGSPIYDPATQEASWDFTLTSDTYLDVTDAFNIGDVFTMYNGTTLIGTTGPFDLSGPELEEPDPAFGSAQYSWGRWLLPPGDYSINGVLSEACCDVGAAFMRLVPVNGVPEPDNWALMIAGFGLVGAAMRRRAAAAA